MVIPILVLVILVTLVGMIAIGMFRAARRHQEIQDHVAEPRVETLTYVVPEGQDPLVVISALKMLVQYGDGRFPDLKDPFHPNGVLASVSVEELSAASAQLPPPVQGEPDLREAEVDVERIGRVRITFQLREMRHHKSSHLHWSAVFAQPI